MGARPIDPAITAASQVARALASEVAEFSVRGAAAQAVEPQPPLEPQNVLLAEYDHRITDEGLRVATRSRFVSTHYADAVEAGVKALNELVRARTGSTKDGDELMTTTFSANKPRLRLNRLRSDSDRSEQRGHMMLCQGVVAAWRNPRAHSSRFDDEPETALMMLETLQHLMAVTRKATRTRTKKVP
jgi:uncharacterized protein (TIGR02391 family)